MRIYNANYSGCKTNYLNLYVNDKHVGYLDNDHQKFYIHSADEITIDDLDDLAFALANFDMDNYQCDFDESYKNYLSFKLELI